MKVPQPLLDLLAEASRDLDRAERDLGNCQTHVIALKQAIQAVEAEAWPVVLPEDNPPPARRPRRNIRDLVAAKVRDGARTNGFVPGAAAMARDIGCRISQVEAALRAINEGKNPL